MSFPLLIAVALVTWPPLLVAQEVAAPAAHHLRIAWGGDREQPTRWSGRIVLTGGSLGNMRLLGMDADAAASIWLEGNTIYVDDVRPHDFDGVDVRVTPTPDARLVFELSAEHLPAPMKADVAVADVLREPFRQAIDQRQNVVLVYRSPGDVLRFETDREPLVFAPGEEFALVARPRLPELAPSTTIDVTATLTAARGGPVLWSEEQKRVPVPLAGEPTASIRIPLPAQEGVYAVRVSVGHPPGFHNRFLPVGGNKPLAERAFQVVVLASTTVTPVGELQWETVLEIDPANPRWWQRLPNWTQVQRLPGVGPRPLGSIIAGAVDHPLGRFIELPGTTAGDEPHWQAYPLPIEKPGLAHRLEVEYPADVEQHLGLSLLESNAAGRAVPISRDSGVYVEGLGRAEQTERHVHRLAFWPRTNSPLLLVTNQHPTATARFGALRVLRSRNGRLADDRAQPSWRDAERLVAAYVARPLVPETFGASEGLDAASGQSVDDWQTFFEAAERLADYLPYAGYNGAVVSAWADGSSIYPSRRLQPTPMHNTGRMVDGAADLGEADSLELMLRLFDRRGLALVPALQLATPLPELERLRRAGDPQSSGIEYVGPDGRTWLEANGTNRGLAPYYNLLDARVQQALVGVASEILERYGEHGSLAGLAVQLSADGYAQLPGLEWGLDDATMAAFARDTGIDVGGEGPGRFAVRQEALLGEHAEAWRSWRAARVSQFYRQLAGVIRAAGAEKRLLLSTEEMFNSPRLRGQLRPSVQSEVRLERLMFDLGIHAEELEREPGIVLCRARYIEPAAPLVDRAINLEINDAVTGAERRASDPSPGAMFFHRPQRQRMTTFDAKSPVASYTRLVTQSSADASAARRRFVLAAGHGDPEVIVDGGELLPMGQEEATRRVLRVLQTLPRGEGKTTRQQPIAVRAYESGGRTTLVVINESPWSAEADIALDVPHDTRLEPLVANEVGLPGDSASPPSLRAGRQTWSLKLEPYDVRAVRTVVGLVEVAGVRARVSDAAKAELEARVAELGERDLTAQRGYRSLANAGFEPLGGGGPLPGWRLVGDGGAAAELDATTPRGGKTCVYLASQGREAILESDPFPTPATGQLAMHVFVRGENLSPTTEVRLVFESDRGGQLYRRFATLGGNRPGAQPIETQWGRGFAFGVNDVPLDSQGQMRIRFEVVGQGDVWIDEIQLYDLLFPLPFYDNRQTERLELLKWIDAARRAYETERWTDCVQLVESYWPRFLLAYTPMVAPPIAQEGPAAAPREQPAATPEEKAPSLGERWKSYVPSVLRF